MLEMSGKIKTVLLIDYDSESLELLEKHLTSRGIVVAKALHVIDALAIVRNDKPDLIIMEHMKTGGRDFELCLSLQHRGIKVPIIIASSMELESYVDRAKEYGLEYFLKKPVDLTEIDRMLETVEANLPEFREEAVMELKKTALIIDKEEGEYQELSATLKKRGYKTVWAPDSVQAITKAKSAAPDLIFLEIVLEGENGFVICDRLHQAGIDIPVIIVSHLEPYRYQLVAAQHRITHCLQKPPDEAMLIEAIESVEQEQSKRFRKKDILVLIVDYDKDSYSALNQYLNDQGFNTIWGTDSLGAFTLVKNQRPDLIIMEVLLGSESGFMLCERLRKARLDIPVIILSKLEPHQYEVVAKGYGICNFLEKPPQPEALLSAIDALLAAKE